MSHMTYFSNYFILYYPFLNNRKVVTIDRSLINIRRIRDVKLDHIDT